MGVAILCNYWPNNAGDDFDVRLEWGKKQWKLVAAVYLSGRWFWQFNRSWFDHFRESVSGSDRAETPNEKGGRLMRVMLTAAMMTVALVAMGTCAAICRFYNSRFEQG